MKNLTKPFVYPDNFRQRLHNLKLDAQETLVKILLEWKEIHNVPNATMIAIPEGMRSHHQATNGLGPDSYVIVAAVNEFGICDEDENFFGWDDLGHENDIINITEYVEGILLYLMQPDPQRIIQNVLNGVMGDTNEDRNHNESVAGMIIDVLQRKGVSLKF